MPQLFLQHTRAVYGWVPTTCAYTGNALCPDPEAITRHPAR